jgi:hypothetical protein
MAAVHSRCKESRITVYYEIRMLKNKEQLFKVLLFQVLQAQRRENHFQF